MIDKEKKTITAFTENSDRTWEKNISIVYFGDKSTVPVLDMGWPIQYSLTKDFLDRLKETSTEDFNIDMAGRNHGVQECVCIKVKDILDFLKEENLV